MGTGVPEDILSSLGTGVGEDKMSSVGTGLLDAPARPSGGGRPSHPLPGTCSGAACGADDAFGALSANRRQLSAPQANVSLDLLAGSALNRRLLAKSAPNGYECPRGRSKRGEQGATARADAGRLLQACPKWGQNVPGHPRPHRGHARAPPSPQRTCCVDAASRAGLCYPSSQRDDGEGCARRVPCREGGSPAESLPTWARAQRSLPSSDLNGAESAQ